MFCEQAEMLLSLLVLEEIEDEQKAELLAHIEACPACKEKLGDLRVTVQLLREGLAAQPAPTLGKERRAALLKAAGGMRKKRKLKIVKRLFQRDEAESKETPAWTRLRMLGTAAMVLFVVGLLAALLLPALSSAREEACRAVTSENGRQISYNYDGYINDHSGRSLSEADSEAKGSAMPTAESASPPMPSDAEKPEAFAEPRGEFLPGRRGSEAESITVWTLPAPRSRKGAPSAVQIARRPQALRDRQAAEGEEFDTVRVPDRGQTVFGGISTRGEARRNARRETASAGESLWMNGRSERIAGPRPSTPSKSIARVEIADVRNGLRETGNSGGGGPAVQLEESVAGRHKDLIRKKGTDGIAFDTLGGPGAAPSSEIDANGTSASGTTYFGWPSEVSERVSFDTHLWDGADSGGKEGYNVLYGDGAVKWGETNFASDDPRDNIFTDRVWHADTDSYVYVSEEPVGTYTYRTAPIVQRLDSAGKPVNEKEADKAKRPAEDLDRIVALKLKGEDGKGIVADRFETRKQLGGRAIESEAKKADVAARLEPQRAFEARVRSDERRLQGLERSQQQEIALSQQAADQFSRGRYRASIESAKKVLERDPDNVFAREMIKDSTEAIRRRIWRDVYETDEDNRQYENYKIREKLVWPGARIEYPAKEVWDQILDRKGVSLPSGLAEVPEGSMVYWQYDVSDLLSRLEDTGEDATDASQEIVDLINLFTGGSEQWDVIGSMNADGGGNNNGNGNGGNGNSGTGFTALSDVSAEEAERLAILRNGYLMVRHTPETHGKVQELLERLRVQDATQAELRETKTPQYVRLNPDEAEGIEEKPKREVSAPIAMPVPKEEIKPEPSVEETLPPSEDPELPAASAFVAGPVNPWVMTAKDCLSTFGIDVDTASYRVGCSYIRSNYLPPAASVRMEEYVNAFDYNYPQQTDNVFTVCAEAGPAPFGRGLTLLKVGIRGKVLGREARKPAHLVFVVDTSGSMAKPDRIELVRYALNVLVGQLGKRDRVSLITYSTHAQLALEAVSASDKAVIRETIASMRCRGSTNLLEGLKLGYSLAERAYRSGEINRVILCSDGIANVGAIEAEELLKNVETYRKNGITFTAVGFGSGAYNDALMEQLADKGDGNYVFVDTKAEARRVFIEEMAAILQTIAKDAKIQVAFNPDYVRRYRLIGFENRDIADKDFRNDAVDAGEVGSGQSSTALYEVELLPKRMLLDSSMDIGTVYVRYRNIETGKVEEISHQLSSDLTAAHPTPKTAPRFFLAACAAEFAEILRQSEHAQDGSLEKVRFLLEQVAVELPLDSRVQELLSMVKASKGLPRAK